MKNRIQKFVHSLFGTIRTFTDEKGDPWLVGKDVAKVLGYDQPDKAITRHVDEDDRMKRTVTDSLNREQLSFVINESGLYSLALSSKLPKAKEFKKWVTSEVLPQIRKTGGYIPVHDAEGNVVSDAELILRAQRILERTIEEKDALIATQQQQLLEQRPKVLFAKAVELSEDCYTIGDVAHILSSNRVKIGRQRFFNWLRRYKYLQKKSRRPVQKWVEDIFIPKYDFASSDGERHTNIDIARTWFEWLRTNTDFDQVILETSNRKDF